MNVGDSSRSPYVLFDGFSTEPRLDHAECVAVASDGALWAGGEAGQIYRIHDGSINLVASTGGFILGIAFGQHGQLWACDMIHHCVWELEALTGAVLAMRTSVPGHELMTPNFPVPLAAGGLLVSDSGGRGQANGRIVQLFPEHGGGLWTDELFEFANGLALDLAAGWLYIAETFRERIVRVPIDRRSCEPVGPAELFVEIPGYLPDGLLLDPFGNLIIGCYEPSTILSVSSRDAREPEVSVLAHDPTAHLLCHPTNLALRGEELVIANLGRWHLSGMRLRVDD